MASVGAMTAITRPARADYLVVAPHPDDDVITAAGVAYRARRAGTRVWVAYMTNGDFYPENGWGLRRADEALAGQMRLGASGPGDLLFLGYPDASLQNLYGPGLNRSTPFVPQSDPQAASDASIRANRQYQREFAYTRAGSTPYSQLRTGTAARATGENVIADLVHILQNRPITDVFVLAPTDQHPDHSATARFVIEAVATASRASTITIHFSYVWDQTGINPYVWPLAPNPATYFTEPPALAGKDDPYRINYSWNSRESLDVPLALQLTDWTQNLKALAIDAHDTQGGFTAQRDQGHISSFVHKDEIFWPRRVVVSNGERFASARVPVPNAGLDQTAPPGGSVSLDGTGSLVFDGRTLTYAWRQAEGPSVTLTGAATARPSFTVPAAAQGTAYVFELHVGDGVSTSVADAVTVRVGAATTPDAGVDAGVDAGADSGVRDAGTSDSGADAGAASDAGAGTDSGLDSGADSGAQLDASIETGALADSSTTLADADAIASTDAAATAPDGGAEAGTSAWPGDEDTEQDVDEIVGGADGPSSKKDSGCAVTITERSSWLDDSLLVCTVAAMLLRRRRSR
jgi:LmbE family N-acetylglucosaminyl deacetylase